MGILFFVVLILLLPKISEAATYFVRSGATGTGCTNSTTDACPTIAIGLTKLLANGDILDIGAGTFYERIIVPRSNITIRGAGSTSTIVDGTTDAGTSGWTLATNADRANFSGQGIYWKTLPANSCTMTVNGEALWQVAPANTAFADEALTAAPDATLASGGYFVEPVDYWGGIEGTWWSDPSTPTKYYIRFRNREAPSTKSSIRVSPGGSGCSGSVGVSTIDVNGVSNVTISNMTVQGGTAGIRIRGASNNVIIENNIVKHGLHRITVDSGNAAIIRNNTLIGGAYGFGPGKPIVGQTNWEGANPSTARQRASFVIYQWAKYYRNTNGTGYDTGIQIAGATATQVYGNTINTAQWAIHLWTDGPGADIHDNTIDSSMVGILWNYSDAGSAMNDNRFYNNTITNVDMCMNLNGADAGNNQQTNGKFFGNKCWQAAGAGYWIYIRAELSGVVNAGLTYYHNTFIGGQKSVDASTAASMANIAFINNIFQAQSSGSVIFRDSNGQPVCGPDPKSWSRNWTYGVAPNCTWVVAPNYAGSSPIFSSTSPPVNWTPSGTALNNGIDVTVPFTIGATNYTALPFIPDYSDSTPDIGAIPTAVTSLASVTWVCDRCSPLSGTATGTANWTQAGITLAIGVNVLMVTATDNLGQTSTDTITVTYAPTFPGNTMAGAWGFEESSGTIIDSSGNSNNGALINGATWTANGHSRQGLTLNGVNQYVLVPNTASLMYTQSFSFSAWVKPASVQTSWKSVVSKEGCCGLYASSIGSVCGAGAPAMWFFVNGNQSTDFTACGPPLAVNQWSHIEGTYDTGAGEVRLYINGVLTGTHAGGATGYIAATTGPLQIGASTYGEYFHGDIDEARTYNWQLPLTAGSNTIPNAACVFGNPLNTAEQSIIRDMNCPVLEGIIPPVVKFPASATGLKVGSAASGLKFGATP